jgi:gliding motility-associated-like protein
LAIGTSPTIEDIPSQVVCNGSLVKSVIFKGSAGTQFSWKNNTSLIGLQPSGEGNINAFIGQNSTKEKLVATITVNPYVGTCKGKAKSFVISVNPSDDPTFNFSSSFTCKNSPVNPFPMIEGTSGGVFTSSPIGLFINSATGEIDVKKSLVNSYNITYVTRGLCSKAATVAMKINSFPTMENVSNQSICSGSMFNVVSFRGTPNTIYQWTNNQPSIGLAKTGTNDIEAFKAKEISSAGQSLTANVIVTPELDGCYGDPKNFTLTVNKTDNPSFVYTQTSFCVGDKNSIPFIQGTKNGTFSSSVGLSLNSSTGAIAIDKSTAGSYVVKYTTSGLCPKDSSVSIIINPKPVVNSIVSQQKCDGANFDPINFVGNASNYNWTSSEPSIGLMSTGSGNIPSFVASGTIRGGSSISSLVTVTPELNGCKGDSKVFSLIVNSQDDPSFTFLDNSFCITEQNPIPVVKGTQGGSFSFKPAGLVIDPKTGKVDIKNSKFGLYDVTYTTNGKCKADSTVKIGIGENPSINPPDFDNIRCEGDIFKAVKFSGNPGTVFEWTNNNTSIGIPATGIGDMPSFKARGTILGGIDTTATISVTPRIGICVGRTVTFKYKVKAKPKVEAGIYDFFTNSSRNKDTIFCKGGKATLVASGSSKVEDYYWFPNNTLSNSTGARVFASTDITQEYVVVGRNEYCVNSDTVKLTVVSPVVNTVIDTAVCAGTNFNTIKFSGNAYAKHFEWTNSNTKIGLLNSGADSISTFKGLISSSVAVEVGFISVTPKFTIQETGEQCKGTPTTFKLTVNKQDNASFTGYQSEYCGTESIVPSPTVTGTKGGFFAVSSKNLAINAATGQLFPSSSKSGEYFVTYTTSGQCSKVDSAKVIIRPQLKAMITGGDTICEGDLNAKIVLKGMNGLPPYVFTYKINDGLQQTISTDFGTDSVVLIVPKLKSGSYNYRIEQVQESSSFNCNVNLTSSTTLVVKPLPSATITGSTVVCVNSAEPEVTITGLNGTSPFTFTYAIDAVPQQQLTTKAGENFVKIKVPTNLKGLKTFSLIEVRDNGLLGCTQSLRQVPTVVVNVKSAPNATVSIAPKSVCLGSSAEVQFGGSNGNAPYEFTFRINGGQSQVVKSTIGNDKISLPITTSKVDTLIYEVIKVQDASTSTCKNEAIKSKDTIVIVPGAFVKQVSDLPICEGKNSDSIVFSGSNGTEFNWVNDNITIGLPALGKNSIPSFIGKNAPNSATIIVTPTTGACLGEQMKFRINVRPKPTPKVLGADNAICSGDSVKLVGLTPQGVSPRYTYYWSPDNTLSCFQCDTNYAKPTKTTNYKVTANDGRGCDFMLVVPIVVRNKPTVYGIDTTICGDPSLVKLKGYGAKSYTWSDGIQNNVAFMPQIGVTTYIVEGTDEFGCKNSDSVNVSVLTPPTAEMSADKLTGFAPLTVNFTNDSKNAVKYEWDFRNNEIITTDKKAPQTATFSKYGDYLVTLKAFNGGCVNVKELVVIVKKLDTLSIIKVPNIFSPNNDGKNDVFSITVNNAKTMRLQIFNRWGNIIHELTETMPYWDGKINGYDAGEGVYFYIFEVEDEAGQKQKGEGFIQLIRD